MAERRRLFRRGFHSLSSLFVVYYWIPPFIPETGLSRDQIALVGISVLGIFEAYRIHKGWLFFGLRDYERKWIAGYFWGASGYVAALLLLPKDFAMLTILGTTLVDPFLGELRSSKRKTLAAPVGFALWCAIALLATWLVPLSAHYPLIPVGAALAVAAESVKFRWVDDNFMMNIVPLLALTALAAATGL